MLSPAYAKYDKFPPMLIQVGTDEVLESDSELVYQSAVKAGVDATLTRYYGMFHVFQMLGMLLPKVWKPGTKSTPSSAQSFFMKNLRH